jgi:hydrogenase maturation protease
MDLRRQLEACLSGRVCVVGVGNTEHGDDGVGVKLAERLRASEIGRGSSAEKNLGRAGVVMAGTSPERHLTALSEGGFDHVLFLDAVEMGAAAGSAVLLDSAAMAARFPQVSTHKLSLGLLAQQLEASGRTRVWLLGVQPASLRAGHELSPAVETSLGTLARLLSEAIAAGRQACGGAGAPQSGRGLPPVWRPTGRHSKTLARTPEAEARSAGACPAPISPTEEVPC